MVGTARLGVNRMQGLGGRSNTPGLWLEQPGGQQCHLPGGRRPLREQVGHSCSKHVNRSCNLPLIWVEDTHLRISGIYTASKAVKSPA